MWLSPMSTSHREASETCVGQTYLYNARRGGARGEGRWGKEERASNVHTVGLFDGVWMLTENLSIIELRSKSGP